MKQNNKIKLSAHDVILSVAIVMTLTISLITSLASL